MAEKASVDVCGAVRYFQGIVARTITLASFVALLGMLPVHAAQPEFEACSLEDQAQVRQCLAEFPQTLQAWIDTLDKKYGYSEGRRQREQPSDMSWPLGPAEWEAIETLECMSRVAQTQLRFKCGMYLGPNVRAMTWPVIGKEIQLARDFFYFPQSLICGGILHEISHKCGTTDTGYFQFPSTPPSSSTWVHWSRIADTYRYWFRFGLCIPGEDCGGGAALWVDDYF